MQSNFMMAIVCVEFLNREVLKGETSALLASLEKILRKNHLYLVRRPFFFRSDNAQQWGNRTCKTSRAASYPKPYLAPKEVQNTSVMVHLPATLLTP